MGYQIGSLLSVLADQPRMPGALCTEVPRLFDHVIDDDVKEPPTLRRARHTQALEYCAQCPALDACREWADTLDPTEVLGVLAGEIRTGQLRTRAAV